MLTLNLTNTTPDILAAGCERIEHLLRCSHRRARMILYNAASKRGQTAAELAYFVIRAEDTRAYLDAFNGFPPRV